MLCLLTNIFDKNRIDYTNNMFDIITSGISLLAKIMLGFGIIFTFLYCMRIGFYPRNMTIADVTMFAFPVFSFSIVMGFGIIFGCAATLWFVISLCFLTSIAVNRFPHKDGTTIQPFLKDFRVLNKIRPAQQARIAAGIDNIWLFIVSLLIFFLMILSILLSYFNNMERFGSIWPMLSGFCVAGFVFSFVFLLKRAPIIAHQNIDSKENENRNFSGFQKFQIFLIILIIPLCIGGGTEIVKISMRLIGVRADNVSIVVGKDHFTMITGLAEAVGAHTPYCVLPNSDRYIVSGLTVLWHGIGGTAYLEFDDSPGSRRASFEIKDDDLFVLSTTRILSPCQRLEVR
jgi:hypothetical protein